MLHNIDFDDNTTQALIICPTRELCLQITKDLGNFSKYFRNANIVAIYGGASIEQQARQVRRGAQVVVATPGRLIDMINRRFVNIRNIKIVVLDEADEMLNMGFKEDIDEILENVPEERNTWLFSATMPKEVASIAKNYMNQPKEITVGKQNSSAENIEHQYFVVKEKDRYFALKRIIDFYPEIFGIIFCRTRRETQEVAEKLIKDGYNCEALHGDLSQAQRDHVMKKFRERTIQLLCATDVAARGIDVSDISHVINYNLPDDIENYTHRSGRTARAGKSGFSITFVNTRETGRIRDVERQIKKSFIHKQIPDGKEICEKQLFNLIDKMVNAPVNEKGIAPYLPKIEEALSSLSKEDLVKRFVSTEFSRFIDYYKNSQDLNVQPHNKRDRNESDNGRSSRGSDEGFQRLFINMGEMDNVNKGMLVRLICDNSGVSGKDIGRIDIKREFSFVDVQANVANQIKETMTGLPVEGSKNRKVRVELSESQSRDERGGGYRGPKKGGYGGSGKKDFGGKKDGKFRKSFHDKGSGNRKSVFHNEF